MLDQIAATMKTSETIAIMPHMAADGDALGSSFALAQVLWSMGKKVKVILEEDVPLIYNFLPGSNFSTVYDSENNIETDNYDMVAAIDCGDMERLGSRKKLFSKSARTVNLDHHPTNTKFALQNYVDVESSATGEIIFRLLEHLGQKPGKDVAISLYVALMTDTGGFRYSNTTPATHRIAAELITQGVDVAGVAQKVFDTTSFGKVKLTGAALQTLELFENGMVAIMAVTNGMIAKSGAREEDSDGIINMARNIRGVEVAAMLRQLESGEIKVNLRSNNRVDVSLIAKKYTGGGHKKAAGFTSEGNLEDIKNMLLTDIKEAL